MTILITGASWFIGFHTAKKLLEEGEIVIGFDNENNYYDQNIKEERRLILQKYSNYLFYKGNLENLEDIIKPFQENKIDKVINLAAQAGVRYSKINPFAYIQTNIVWFHNLIELSKQYSIKSFVYASSASVYWSNQKQPFSVWDQTDQPISLYGATKKADELIAYSYSYYFNLPTIWLRFFNVYGPRGRPDWAFFIFIKGILERKKLTIFNEWRTTRNFTYIDDIVDGIVKSLNYTSMSNYEIFNLGNPNAIILNDMVKCIEKECGIIGEKEFLPADISDISKSSVDIEHTKKSILRSPKINIEEWVHYFVKWYKDFYI